MSDLEKRLAEQLHNALMCILSEKNEEWADYGFTDEDGEPQLYEDGGNYSSGGIMSGFGEWDFDFREAAETLKGTGFELPVYGSARKFRFDLSAFATKEGAEAVCKQLSDAIRKAEGGAS